MEVRIGIVQSMKEIEVLLPEDAKREKVMKDIESAMSDDTVLWLTDRKGRRVGVLRRARYVLERTHRRFRLGLIATGSVR